MRVWAQAFRRRRRWWSQGLGALLPTGARFRRPFRRLILIGIPSGLAVPSLLTVPSWLIVYETSAFTNLAGSNPQSCRLGRLEAWRLGSLESWGLGCLHRCIVARAVSYIKVFMDGLPPLFRATTRLLLLLQLLVHSSSTARSRHTRSKNSSFTCACATGVSMKVSPFA